MIPKFPLYSRPSGADPAGTARFSWVYQMVVLQIASESPLSNDMGRSNRAGERDGWQGPVGMFLTGLEGSLDL